MPEYPDALVTFLRQLGLTKPRIVSLILERAQEGTREACLRISDKLDQPGRFQVARADFDMLAELYLSYKLLENTEAAAARDTLLGDPSRRFELELAEKELDEELGGEVADEEIREFIGEVSDDEDTMSEAEIRTRVNLTYLRSELSEYAKSLDNSDEQDDV